MSFELMDASGECQSRQQVGQPLALAVAPPLAPLALAPLPVARQGWRRLCHWHARTLKGTMLFVLFVCKQKKIIPAFQSVPASAASGSGSGTGSGSGSGEGAHKWLTYIVDTSSGNITVDEMVGGNFGRSRADRKKKKAKRDQKFFFWIFLPHRVAV
jgi:hypothetical protein